MKAERQEGDATIRRHIRSREKERETPAGERQRHTHIKEMRHQSKKEISKSP